MEDLKSGGEELVGVIRKIDSLSTARLCSGQVIVTLQNVVKELMENSLDAGASCVKMTFRNYGQETLELWDDGTGIEEGNFQYLGQAHATSKLISFTDLQSVSTFGFRGEALYSISVLSRMTIITKHASSAQAVKLEFNSNGEIVSKTPTGGWFTTSGNFRQSLQ